MLLARSQVLKGSTEFKHQSQKKVEYSTLLICDVFPLEKKIFNESLRKCAILAQSLDLYSEVDKRW